MSKPEFWWCLKSDAGVALLATATRYRSTIDKWKRLGFNVVRIRVVEMPVKKAKHVNPKS